MTPEERAKVCWSAIDGDPPSLDPLQNIIDAIRDTYEDAARIADREAKRYREKEDEHTGTHGEIGEEGLMARAAGWACNDIAAAIRERGRGDG